MWFKNSERLCQKLLAVVIISWPDYRYLKIYLLIYVFWIFFFVRNVSYWHNDTNWVNIWKGDGRQRQVEFSLLPSILKGPIFSAPQLLEEVSSLGIPGPPPSQAFLRGVWDCGADRRSRMMNGSTVRVVGCRTWNRNHKSKPSCYWNIENRVEKEGGK